MADEFDFNPDFSDFDHDVKTEIIPAKVEAVPTVAKNDENNPITYNHLVESTRQHIEDDLRVRNEVAEITGMLDDAMTQMTIKELLEYLKIKLREREFHTRCIFDAYNFVQKSEISREMLVGSERKERVIQSMDNQKVTKLMGFLNPNHRSGS